MLEYKMMGNVFGKLLIFPKWCIRNYNHIFFWGVVLLTLGAHLFPLANKFDLVERFLPVMGIVFLITTGCVLGWIFSWWKRRKTDEAKFKGPDGWLVAALIGFVLWSGLSFVFADVKTFGFTEIYMLILGTLLFLYFSTVPSIKKWLPYGLSLLLLIQALFGIYGFLTTDHTRFFGLFYNPEIKADAWPNAYALMSLLTFPWLLFALFKNGIKKIGAFLVLKSVFAGFVFGTFLAVFSRAGYVAFGVEVIFLGIFFGKSFKGNFRRCMAAVVIIIVVGFGVLAGLQKVKSLYFDTTDVKDRLTFSDSGGASSFSERFEFFFGSLELIKKEPLFGYGPSSFKWAYPQVQEGFLALSDHPHNWILKLAVERGAPAAALFLVFLLVLFVKTNPFSKSSPIFVKVAWASALAALAHSMVDFNFNFISNYLIFWLIVAALASGVSANREKVRFKKSDLLSLIAILVMIVVLVLSSVRIVKESWHYLRLRSVFGPIVNTIAMGDTENYHPLLPRWTLLRLDDAYAKNEPIVDKDGNFFSRISDEEVTANRKILLENHLKYNPYDASAYSRLGQIALDENDLSAARDYFKRATEVNPKNTFRYYAEYASVLSMLGDDSSLASLREKVKPLIEEYMPLYEKNLHFTQRDNEMRYIEELQRIFK